MAVDTSDNPPVCSTVERKRGRDGVARPVGCPLSPRMVTRGLGYLSRLETGIRVSYLTGHTQMRFFIGIGEM